MFTGRKHTEETRKKIREARSRQVITEEHKKNISKSLMGRVFSEERNRRISLSLINKPQPWLRGEKNPNWKGGLPNCKNCQKRLSKRQTKNQLCRQCFAKLILSGENAYQWKGGVTSPNEKIRKSVEYKLWRKAVFERDCYTCQTCGIRGVRLNADHVKPFALFPELRLAIDNGRTLCEPCHRKTPTYGRFHGVSSEKLQMVRARLVGLDKVEAAWKELDQYRTIPTVAPKPNPAY